MRLFALACLAALACASAAEAKPRIIAVCGYDLCQIDPGSGKTTKLTRDGTKSKRYASPSLGRGGRRVAFIRDGDLYLGNANARDARRLAKGTIFNARMAPDGTRLIYIESLYTIVYPATFYPYYTPPVFGYIPFLDERRFDETKETSLSRRVITAGYLGSRVVHQADGENSGPDTICLQPTDPNAEKSCERIVASEPTRALSSPAASPDGRFLVVVAEPFSTDEGYTQKFRGAIALFNPSSGQLTRDLTRGTDDTNPAVSPDGKRVVFNRGNDLYTVRLSGADAGRAKLLRRNAREATWGG